METTRETIRACLEEEFSNILLRISKDYKLNLETLKKRYMPKPKKSGSRKQRDAQDVKMMVLNYENGQKYLVDEEKNVYTYNIEAPHHIGELLADNKIVFYADGET